MKEIIKIIDEISKWGLSIDVKIEEKEKDLEKHLVQFYAKYFEIKYEFDDKDYTEFIKPNLTDLRKNISLNFPDFGLYHNLADSHKFEKEADLIVGDAVDDLIDITLGLLEIKWRYEYNSENDALWYFQLTFYTHTQQHILNLLNFLKSKNA